MGEKETILFKTNFIYLLFGSGVNLYLDQQTQLGGPPLLRPRLSLGSQEHHGKTAPSRTHAPRDLGMSQVASKAPDF